jgi:hypothetical protein
MAQIDSFYMHGTDGRMVLFYRPKGREVVYYMGDQKASYIQQEDVYCIQYNGSPEVSSGYHCDEFQTFAAAKSVFDEMEIE